MSGSITFGEPQWTWIASGRFFGEVMSAALEAVDDNEQMARFVNATTFGFVTLYEEDAQSLHFASLLLDTATRILESQSSTMSAAKRRSLEELENLSAAFLQRFR